MEMVTASVCSGSKLYVANKEEDAALKIIHKIGRKVVQSKDIGHALMLAGAILIVAGSFYSKNPSLISFAKGVASKALSSW